MNQGRGGMKELKDIYGARLERVYAYMRENSFGAAVFHDSEDNRDPALRYLTGLPGDGVLVLTDEGRSCLCPWDENLAAERAHADSIIPLTKFSRDAVIAVKEILRGTDPSVRSIALPPVTPYSRVKKYEAELPEWNVICEEKGVHEAVREMRAQKDSYEIECTKKACLITSAMTDEFEAMLRAGKSLTETDVALFIERRLREEGCERTSFDTLAAGPGRSFAIHAFPGYTAGAWGSCGLSILDYGVCFEGYASDCTITVARGPLSKEQERILDLVQAAADECLGLYVPGGRIIDAARKADEIFSAEGRSMPHGLGHGTGLEIHEAPFINPRAGNRVFMPGNIVTLEPGLYDARLGGCRLENDILITESGGQVLTNSRIIRL